MAGRKAVMVDTDTWNRLEKYRHNAYIRAIGDAVGDLLTVNNSDKYYVGLKHTTENKLVACSFGRTDDEAVRNLLKKYDELTMGDVRSEEDLIEGEECYFTIECTKRLYDLKEFIDGVYIVLNHPRYPVLYPFSDSLSDIVNIEIIEDQLNPINGDVDEDKYEGIHIADINDGYYALTHESPLTHKLDISFVSPTIQGIVDAVFKSFNDIYLKYSKEAHALEFNGDIADNDVEIPDGFVDLSDNIFWLTELYENSSIHRCSKQLYLEAVAAGLGPHEFSLKGKVECDEDVDDRDYLISMYENEPYINVSGLFGVRAINETDGKSYLISCGTTFNDALKNASNLNLPESYDISPTAVICTKELFTAFIMSDFYDKKDGTPIECHRVKDENGDGVKVNGCGLMDFGPAPATMDTK